jgi:hypothetical protein
MADTVFGKDYSFGATERGDYDWRGFLRKYPDLKLPSWRKSDGLAGWVAREVEGQQGFAVRKTYDKRDYVKDVFVGPDTIEWVLTFNEELKAQGASRVNCGLDEETKSYFEGLVTRFGNGVQQQIKDVTQQIKDVARTVQDHAERFLRGENRLDGHDQAIGDLKAGQSKVREEQEKINGHHAEDILRMDKLERQLREEREARERLERVYHERLGKLEKRRFGL